MNATEPIGAIETHLSEIFLGHDRVFKRLKPVSLPFIDLRTSEQRCAAATAEYRQNHAISPQVYLGLADVLEDGVLADRLIVMQRLRAEDELSQHLAGPDADAAICAAARRIAKLHLSVPALSGEAAAPALAPAITKNWEDNFASLRQVVGTIIDPDDYGRVITLVHSWLAGRAHLLEERVASGWVRQGHGDLRAEHVYCTADRVELIDCVAFDPSLRVSDVLSDVAFLAMDLERLAGRRASRRLMHVWGEFTGEHHPSALAHFYVAYRAHVRAKVAAIRASQGDDRSVLEAREYHDRCLQHLELASIRAVIVGGGPGTGKSTIANGVAQAIGGAWLRSDEIRKDLAGLGHNEHAFAEPDEGIYTPEMNALTAKELRRQAQQLLQRGISVVLDSTWQHASDREAIRELVRDSGAELTELRCDLPRAVAKERIARRLASLYQPSDATPDLVDAIGDRFDAWPEAVPISTSTKVEVSVAAAVAATLRPDGARAANSQATDSRTVQAEQQTLRLQVFGPHAVEDDDVFAEIAVHVCGYAPTATPNRAAVHLEVFTIEQEVIAQAA